MERIIFLDVDGVLNDNDTYEIAPYGGCGIANWHLRQLKDLVDMTGAKIVLSSDWRFNAPYLRHHFPAWKTAKEDWEYLNTKFADYDLTIEDTTPFIQGATRGEEIKAWLIMHKAPIAYVILDDLPFDEFTGLTRHLIHTNADIGLEDEDLLQAKMILDFIDVKG